MASPRRSRVKHVQQELFRHGGKRKGAGRPPKGKRAGAPHKMRPTLKGRFPVHVVLRVLPELGNLRRRTIYKAIRWATVVAAKRDTFRIVHVSIQREHVHLLVEAENKTALSRGMQTFEISAAKQINATIKDASGGRRRGQVFEDRYHEEIIETPRQARHALAYVLNNWRKHREDRSGLASTWKVDPFSTGVLFGGWKELEASQVMWKWRETYQPMIVWWPKTWILSEGWRRYGLIGTDEVPSARRVPARS
jgi:REP element-mobilizing transposase RayT